MLARIPAWVTRSRFSGRLAWVPVIVRLGAGTFIALIGVGKFADHAQEVRDFRGFGVPIPEIGVPLAGTIEVIGGVLVLIGLLTRPAAVAIALNLVGALLTAGINEGGSFHLVVGPTVLFVMLFLVWSGAGPYSFDERLGSSRSASHTGERDSNTT